MRECTTQVRIIHLSAYPKNTKEIRVTWKGSTKVAKSLIELTDRACRIAIQTRTIKRALISILASPTVSCTCKVEMVIHKRNMQFSRIEFLRPILSRTPILLCPDPHMVRAQWRSLPMLRSPETSAWEPNKRWPPLLNWQQTFWKSWRKERKV